MTAWTALTPLRDILVVYYFGSPIAYYTSLCLLLFLALIMAGLELRMALIFTVPALLTFSVYGLFGSYTFIANIILLVVGIVYAYAIIELFT